MTPNHVVEARDPEVSAHHAGVGLQHPRTWPQRITSRRRRLRARRALGSVLSALVSLGVGIAAWYLVVLVFQMKPYVLPYPHQVAETMWTARQILADNGMVTLREILAGFAVGGLLGVLTGMVLTFSRIINRLLYPLVVFAQATPKVALAPLFLAWFGFSFMANLAVTVLIAIFPVIVNTMLGLRSIHPDMVQLGRSMGASPLRLFWRIRLPIAAPTIFAGLKLAMAFSAIGAVIGEFVAGSQGLGYVIQYASGRLNTSLSIGAIVAVSVMALILYYLVEAVERVVLRGHPRQEAANVAT